VSKQFASLAALAPVLAAAAPPVLIGVAIVAVVALLSKDGKKAAPEVDAAPEEPPAPAQDELPFADDEEAATLSEADAEIESEEADPIPLPPLPAPRRVWTPAPAGAWLGKRDDAPGG